MDVLFTVHSRDSSTLFVVPSSDPHIPRPGTHTVPVVTLPGSGVGGRSGTSPCPGSLDDSPGSTFPSYTSLSLVSVGYVTFCDFSFVEICGTFSFLKEGLSGRDLTTSFLPDLNLRAES